MKKRLAFKCWKCNRKYTLMKEITMEQELIVACPYCDVEAVVKLEPHRIKKRTVLRGEEEQTIGYEYDFPELIPTQEPENK